MTSHGLSVLKRERRGIVLAFAVLVMTVAPSGAWAAKEGNHCISPTGTDLNELWGVTEAIVASFCTEIGAGRNWRVGQAWFMNRTFKKVPKSFVPTGATPIEDFIAKLVGVKYVVDPGTAQEQTYVFTNVGDLGTIPEIPDGGSVAQGLTMGVLGPLSIGVHVVDSYWSMSAMHCDGLGRVIEQNCLPAGDTLYDHITFEVATGHN